MDIPVGYTSDGKVFICIISEFEGKKIQTWKTWSPADARILAEAFRGAADEAERITLEGGNGQVKHEEKKETPEEGVCNSE